MMDRVLPPQSTVRHAPTVDLGVANKKYVDDVLPTPTKGRLLVADGTGWQPLTVGSNNQVLTADSGESTGVKWATPASGSGFRGARAYASSTPTLSTGTAAAISLDAEDYDTNSLHDNSTNPSRINLDTVGYWAISGAALWGNHTVGRRLLQIRHTGTVVVGVISEPVQESGVSTSQNVFTVVKTTVTTGYAELWARQDSGGNLSLATGNSFTWMEAHYLGA